jgi:hypothetical protein
VSQPIRDPWECHRGAQWERNVEILQGKLAPWPQVRWTDESRQCLAIRIPGKPFVDFWPSTGKWMKCGGQSATSGGAEAFLRWFAKQRREE